MEVGEEECGRDVYIEKHPIAHPLWTAWIIEHSHIQILGWLSSFVQCMFAKLAVWTQIPLEDWNLTLKNRIYVKLSKYIMKGINILI